MKKMRIVISIIITCLVSLIYKYLFLPPLNIKSMNFIMWVIITLLTLGITFLVQQFIIDDGPEEFSIMDPKFSATFGISSFILLIFLMLSLISRPMFNGENYSKILNPITKEFKEDYNQIKSSQIPIIDKDTAIRLSSRKFGEVVELVSQFNINNNFTQINYKSNPTRVGYIEYAGIIKWMDNNSNGIPYYIQANMSNQNVSMVKLENPMRYSPGEYFGRDLMRYARKMYPTEIFYGEYFFEINDEGNPYWVIPTVKYNISFNGGEDIKGIILVNACNGETVFYEVDKVPEWIDNVYPSNMLLNFANWNGSYKEGWFNSVFGQKNVVKTTEGYNYLAINDDVWLYTGITSATSDESNIGFILINKRTKETKYYSINGAEEYSAMASAEGKVQEKRYKSTFPILLNVGDKATYFVSLKDAAGLVKLYAYISVEDYQIVGVGESPDEAQRSYILALNGSGNSILNNDEKIIGLVKEIYTSIVDGNTNYYLRLEGDNNYYLASVKASNLLPLLKIGEKVELSYFESENNSRLKIVNRLNFELGK